MRTPLHPNKTGSKNWSGPIAISIQDQTEISPFEPAVRHGKETYTTKYLYFLHQSMSVGNSSKHVECRCTRCKYNNNGNCGYQGRVLIDQNGECQVMETGFGGDRGPFG